MSDMGDTQLLLDIKKSGIKDLLFIIHSAGKGLLIISLFLFFYGINIHPESTIIYVLSVFNLLLICIQYFRMLFISDCTMSKSIRFIEGEKMLILEFRKLYIYWYVLLILFTITLSIFF